MSDAKNWAGEHSHLIAVVATVGALGTCLVPVVGIAVCGSATVLAFAARTRDNLRRDRGTGAIVEDAAITTFTFGVASLARPVIGGLVKGAAESGHPGAPIEWSIGGLYAVPELIQLPDMMDSEKW